MNTLSRKDYCALLANDLGAFVERCFRHLNPGADYIHGWHIDVLTTWLSSFENEGTRMIVNLPPRHLKSVICSVALPAWLLGRNPSARIICASYGAELAEQFSRECRSIMESDWYRAVFPKTRLLRQTATQLTTTRNGSRIATSVDGVLTGRGADYIILDDPIKPDEALSQAVRNKVNAWFSNTVFSRLNDKREGRILIVMQRLNENDLTGHLLGRGEWSHLKLPAIAEDTVPYTYEVMGEQRVHTHRVGEALHPEREPLEVLESIRATIGAYNFAGQYQQAPTPLEGGMVKRAWFKEYGEGERPETFDLVLQSWDTANKPGELNDYSVCTTWGMAGNRIYLLHVFRKKLSYPELKRAVRDQHEHHRPEVVLVEDKASGTLLIQELVSEGMSSVKAYKPQAGLDKHMRMNAQTSVIENGLVYLPKSAEWLDAYVHEMTIFPAGKHDDQVDSTAQALHWFKTARPVEPGILTFYRQRYGTIT